MLEIADLVTFTYEILIGKLHFFVQCFRIFTTRVNKIIRISVSKIIRLEI